MEAAEINRRIRDGEKFFAYAPAGELHEFTPVQIFSVSRGVAIVVLPGGASIQCMTRKIYALEDATKARWDIEAASRVTARSTFAIQNMNKRELIAEIARLKRQS